MLDSAGFAFMLIDLAWLVDAWYTPIKMVAMAAVISVTPILICMVLNGEFRQNR